MNVVVTVVAVVIVIAGVYFSQTNQNKTDEPTENSEVLSVDVESLEEEAGTNTPTPKNTPTNTSTPTPTPTSINVPSISLSDYKYPNSSVVSSDDNSLLLNSTDDTDKITDWYQDKIRSLGMNAKTFVKTKTNDNVLNKLVGAKPGLEVRVEITKNSGDSAAKITINI